MIAVATPVFVLSLPFIMLAYHSIFACVPAPAGCVLYGCSPHAQRPQCACLFSRVSPMHGWLRVPGSYYRATARELKRLEAISFSPIQNKFGETVDGLASIRAFGLQVRWRCAWYNGALVWQPTSFVSAVE